MKIKMPKTLPFPFVSHVRLYIKNSAMDYEYDQVKMTSAALYPRIDRNELLINDLSIVHGSLFERFDWLVP